MAAEEKTGNICCPHGVHSLLGSKGPVPKIVNRVALDKGPMSGLDSCWARVRRKQRGLRAGP